MSLPLTVYGLTVCRFVIGLVFAFALAGKAMAPRSFARGVRGLLGSTVRWPVIRLLALAVVVGEATTVAAMVVGGGSLWWGFMLAGALLIAFTVAILRALSSGRSVSCNCFGRTAQLVSAYDVVRNLVLIGSALAATYLVSVAGVSSAPDTAVGALHAGAAASVVVIILLHLEDIAIVMRRAGKPAQTGGQQ